MCMDEHFTVRPEACVEVNLDNFDFMLTRVNHVFSVCVFQYKHYSQCRGSTGTHR